MPYSASNAFIINTISTNMSATYTYNLEIVCHGGVSGVQGRIVGPVRGPKIDRDICELYVDSLYLYQSMGPLTTLQGGML